MAKQILAVIDLQYGSTGKGQVAGTLAHHLEPDTVATAWGPNAGHTFRYGNFKFVSRMLATSALAPRTTNILIGPGSVVDLHQLADEIILAKHLLRGKHLVIHPQAAILKPSNAKDEQALVSIGSTMKGTAEAVIDKMRRNYGGTIRHSSAVPSAKLERAVIEAEMSLSFSSLQYDAAIDNSKLLFLEGAQGFSLGIHTDFYPYTTSRDVSTTQLLADCRVPIPLNGGLRVVGVCRTYPIRVANRYNDLGMQVGTSGGCYPDQEEITWESIGREPELTTVTKLPRRLFTFSLQQIREACRVCRPTSLALTFCDYMANEEVIKDLVDDIHSVSGAVSYVRLCSMGPDMADLSYRSPSGEMEQLSSKNVMASVVGW